MILALFYVQTQSKQLIDWFNASAILLASQAELEKDMTAKADSILWDEIFFLTDHILCPHQVAIQATGRTMGLMSTKAKEELLDTAVIH